MSMGVSLGVSKGVLVDVSLTSGVLSFIMEDKWLRGVWLRLGTSLEGVWTGGVSIEGGVSSD